MSGRVEGIREAARRVRYFGERGFRSPAVVQEPESPRAMLLTVAKDLDRMALQAEEEGVVPETQGLSGLAQHVYAALVKIGVHPGRSNKLTMAGTIQRALDDYSGK